jgi:hypothetical protein
MDFLLSSVALFWFLASFSFQLVAFQAQQTKQKLTFDGD